MNSTEVGQLERRGDRVDIPVDRVAHVEAARLPGAVVVQAIELVHAELVTAEQVEHVVLLVLGAELDLVVTEEQRAGAEEGEFFGLEHVDVAELLGAHEHRVAVRTVVTRTTADARTVGRSRAAHGRTTLNSVEKFWLQSLYSWPTTLSKVLFWRTRSSRDRLLPQPLRRNGLDLLGVGVTEAGTVIVGDVPVDLDRVHLRCRFQRIRNVQGRRH
jgi:hypothetical protein